MLNPAAGLLVPKTSSSNRSQGALPTLPSRMACLGLVKRMLVLAYRRVAVSKYIIRQLHVDLLKDSKEDDKQRQIRPSI
jgi:hypothetical protein